MPHILSTSANEIISEESGDNDPVFYNAFPSPLSQQKCYRTLYGKQTGRDDLLFTSMMNLLFSFLKFMVGGSRIFSFCANGMFLWLSSKTNAQPDKIFMT